MLFPPTPSPLLPFKPCFFTSLAFFPAQFLHFFSLQAFPSHPRGRQEVQAGVSKPMGMDGGHQPGERQAGGAGRGGSLQPGRGFYANCCKRVINEGQMAGSINNKEKQPHRVQRGEAGARLGSS